MRTRTPVILILIIAMLTTSGCWNRRELSDLAIVMGIGIDHFKDGGYKVSFQVVNAGEIGTGSTPAKGKAASVIIYSEVGKTLFEAVRKVSQKVPRQLFFAHVRLVVIGESLARKEGIKELFDFFERIHEARLTSTVIVARGDTAESIISTITAVEYIPASNIVSKLSHTSMLWSENPKMEMYDVIQAYSEKGRSLIANGVSLVGSSKDKTKKANIEQTKLKAYLIVSGIGMFKGDKLTEWLDGSKARGVMFVINKVQSTIMNVDYGRKKDAIAMEMGRVKSKVKVRMAGGKPVFHVMIAQEGNINEVHCSIDLSNPNKMEAVEKTWSAETKKEVQSAIKAAQEKQCDIFGFGELLYKTSPAQWKKLEKKWDETFSSVKVNVSVSSIVVRQGMRMKPILSSVKDKDSSGKKD